MVRNSKFDQTITRRSFVLGLAQGGLGALLLGRLYYLQGIEGKKYLTLADENRISFRFIAPQRGVIMDRHGIAIAGNKKFFRLVIIPEGLKDIPASLDRVAQVLGEKEIDKDEILKVIAKKPKFYPTVIKDNLTWLEVSKIELHLGTTPGVFVEETWQRFYPFPESTSHVLGYVGIPTEETIKKDKNPFLRHPDARTGKNGLERIYNDRLNGTPGARHVEVDARGRIVRELKRDPATSGEKLYTTLDITLQEKLKDLLSPYVSGAAVVMDIPTGAIRALVSLPGYDPNSFTHGIRNTEWGALNKDEHRPLVNKALQGIYSPASTFKMVSALSALSNGVITPSTTFTCPGHTYLGNHKFHCYKKGGHGSLTLHHAIARSCDVFFYEIGKRLDIDKLAHTAGELGLGAITAIDLPSEQRGIIPTRAWKMATKKQPWVGGESVISAIGQGYVLTTPLQLAIMTARLASGAMVTPYLVDPQQRPQPLPTIDPYHLQLVQAAMTAVVNDPSGTGRRHKLPWADWQMAGKTGTAQVKRISPEERKRGLIKSIHWPWHLRDNALFVGYAPVHDPRFAVAVVVEHAGFGGAVAAPIAHKIMRHLRENTT